MYELVTVSHRKLAPDDDDVYALDVQRMAGGLAAALASDGRLSLLDPSGLDTVTTWATGAATTTLCPFGAGAPLLCSAGADGAVAVWDVRLRGDAARVAQFRASDAPILSMACSPAAHAVAVGCELRDQTASILLWDVRAAPAARAHYDEVHSDDVTALAFHASDAALLLSGSTDGLVSLHDTRVADADDLTLQTVNHGASIHHAAFLSDEIVFALSHDERFALYHLARDPDPGARADLPSDDLRALLACQYMAGVTPKTDGDGAILGAGSHDRRSFELVFLAKDPATQSWQLDRTNSVGLPGAHGGDVVRAFSFFDEKQLVLTVGEDGAIKAWRPAG